MHTAVSEQLLVELNDRIARGALAVARMQATVDFRETRLAWADFVSAIGDVWEILSKAKQGHARAEQWYAGVEAFRKNDELLTYVFQARNAGVHSAQVRLEEASIQYFQPDGSPVPRHRVVAIQNRGVTYGIPLNHRGGMIVSKKTPFAVASMAWHYAHDLVQELEEKQREWAIA